MLEPLQVRHVVLWGISSQIAWEQAKGSTTTVVILVVLDKDQEFLVACSLGDGCLARDKWGSTTLHIQRCERHMPYALWQLDRLNAICDTNASFRVFQDKGRYPAVRFGVTSKALLGPVYERLYPNGVKVFSATALKGLGPEALAVFWMDDGSLEVRKRKRPKSVKIERSGWLPISKEREQVDAVCRWIYEVTGASGSLVTHRTGMQYLRLFSNQFRIFVSCIQEFVHPCLYYKVDLNRAGTVAEWFSESQQSAQQAA